MRYLKIAGITLITLVALGAVAAAAAVLSAQVAVQKGQGDGRDVIRRVEVLGGRGSQLGISVRDVEESDAAREKTPGVAGAVIDEVESEGPAAKAGIKAGDVMVEFDGERVRSARQLSRLVQETPAGRSVKATVWRDGKKVDLAVTPDTKSGFGLLSEQQTERLGRLGRNFSFSMPERFSMPEHFEMPNFEFDFRMRPGRLGVGVQELSPQLAEYFGVKDGVLVTSVTENSPAAKAGLKAGDVITSVNGATVNDAQGLRRRMADHDAREFTLDVVRDKKTLTLKGTLAEDVERERSRRQSRRPV